MRSFITNDARPTREIISRISMAKSAFNERRLFCTCKLRLNLRKTLVMCYIWSTVSMVLKIGHSRKLIRNT